MTPIKAPHTNSELPKTGAKSRLPNISNAMTTAPVINAVVRRNQRGIGTEAVLDVIDREREAGRLHTIEPVGIQPV
jgi:hypothetical protein